MARAKTQLTGFARFLIFLVIAAPLIFFGVSYYKGEDPLQTLQEAFSQPEAEANEAPLPAPRGEITPPPVSQTEINSEIAKLRDELDFKEKRITDLDRENEELKQQLQKQEADCAEVQSQLDKIKSAIGE